MAYFLEQTDSEIFEFIVEEFKRQNEHLEMIASENYTFPSVMEAMGSILTNKYAEGYPNKRYYGGCEVVDKIESLAIERAKKLFNCQFANVQAHSGSQANNAVYHALLKPYDKILGMDLSCGGHLTHGAKVSLTGKHYQSFSYGVGLDGYIDYEEALKIAQSVKPQIIVCGFSAYPREIDFKKFREIADAVGALLLGDIAHVAGLVVANEHAHPFPHCHVVSSTTHKTLRGPNERLKQLAKDYAKFVDTDSQRKAQNDDKLTIDFEGFIDNAPFEGGKAENFSLILGSKQMLEDFEKALLGMQASEEKEFPLTFPSGYHAEHLAGKEALFKVKLRQIQVREALEINDELAKIVLANDLQKSSQGESSYGSSIRDGKL